MPPCSAITFMVVPLTSPVSLKAFRAALRIELFRAAAVSRRGLGLSGSDLVCRDGARRFTGQGYASEAAVTQLVAPRRTPSSSERSLTTLETGIARARRNRGQGSPRSQHCPPADRPHRAPHDRHGRRG